MRGDKIRKIILVGLCLLLLLPFVSAEKETKLIPFLNHCSCSWECIPEQEMIKDCHRVCSIEIEESEPIECGCNTSKDINRDGKINRRDLFILRIVVRFHIYRERFDMNCDGKVNWEDIKEWKR